MGPQLLAQSRHSGLQSPLCSLPGLTLQRVKPLAPESAEGLPALPLALAVLETSAFPPICDICRPSGSVRDKLLQCGLSGPGQPWPGALDLQRSEVTVTGVTVWAANWGFDICGAVLFLLPLAVCPSATLFHTGESLPGEAECGHREASRTEVGTVLLREGREPARTGVW